MIRQELNLSERGFAKEIGLDVISVHSWETSEFHVSRKTNSKLVTYCEEKSISLLKADEGEKGNDTRGKTNLFDSGTSEGDA